MLGEVKIKQAWSILHSQNAPHGLSSFEAFTYKANSCTTNKVSSRDRHNAEYASSMSLGMQMCTLTFLISIMSAVLTFCPLTYTSSTQRPTHQNPQRLLTPQYKHPRNALATL